MPAFALALIPAAIVALCALLVFYGARTLFGGLLQGMASNIPLIGPTIAGAIGSILDALAGLVQGALEGSSGILIDLLVAINQMIVGFIIGVVRAPALALAWIEDLYSQVANLFVSIVGLNIQIAAEIASRVANVTGLQALISTAQAGVDWIVATFVPEQVRAALAEAARYANVAVAAATAPLAAMISQLQAALAAEIARVMAYAGAIEAQLQHEVWPAIDNLEAVNSWAIPALTSLVSANLITRLATLEADWATTLADCIIPSCSSVRPYRDMLNLLQQTVVLAALAAVIGQAVRDPEGMARTVADAADELTAIGRDTAGMFAGGL